MNSYLAIAADIVPTTDLSELPSLDAHVEPITGWHALVGFSIGVLKGLSPGTDVHVRVEAVLEQAADLAVADRVAWILSGRTGHQHVVLTAPDGYLVAKVTPLLDWAAAMRLEPGEHAPRIVSVATAEGVLPILLPVA